MAVFDLSAKIEMDTTVSESCVKELTERVEMLKELLNDTFHVEVDTAGGGQSMQGLIGQALSLQNLLRETFAENGFGSVPTVSGSRETETDKKATDSTESTSSISSSGKLNAIDLFLKGSELYTYSPSKLARWGIGFVGDAVGSAAEQGLQGYGDFRRIAQEYMESAQELQENFDLLKLSIGRGLLPAVTAATRLLNGFVGAGSDMSKELGHINYVYFGTTEEIEEAAEKAEYTIQALLSLETSDYKEEERQSLKEAGLKELIDLNPGFASYIDTETWEVPGGISSLSGVLTEWKKNALDEAGWTAALEWNKQIENAESALNGLIMKRDAYNLELKSLNAKAMEEAKKLAKEFGDESEYSFDNLPILIQTYRDKYGPEAPPSDLENARNAYLSKKKETDKLNDEIARMELDIQAARDDEPFYVSMYADVSKISEAAAAQSAYNESLGEGIALGEQADDAYYGFYNSDWIGEQLRLAEEGKESLAQIMTEAQETIAQACEAMREDVLRVADSFDVSDLTYANALASANGLAAGYADGYAGFAGSVNQYLAKLDELARAVQTQITGISLPRFASEQPNDTSAFNADGLPYVPYNDYLSYLHKGEAVLTADQAEEWRAGRMEGGGESLSVDTVAAAMAKAISGMAVQMDGQTVGRLVAPAVSSEIAEGMTVTRRYAVV